MCLPAALLADTISISGKIVADTRWRSGEIYLITDDLTISRNATLTIEPGVIVKFQYQEDPSLKRCLYVAGAINSLGTPERPVVFTSDRDDARGGDTNGDGSATAAAAGDWGYIRITGFGSTIEGCDFACGGRKTEAGQTRDFMLWLGGGGAPVDVRDCKISHASDIGVYCEQGDLPLAPAIERNQISNCRSGIVFAGAGITRGTIAGNNISNCLYAIDCRSTSPSIRSQHACRQRRLPAEIHGRRFARLPGQPSVRKCPPKYRRKRSDTA